ncbi:beta-ketoacyl synthase N-terminal-like domain-containing protein [Haloarcula sp. JP-L23]|uniref:thiolase C-terminal domain-containing protein n=1 Tax=Haloarcula sp. JP-L23 TaxID=2716717 RepID=UPI00140EC407|nr:3-ketoacyl-CoA thiolase [Haloarcula sp. JP-L23]
MSTVRVAGVGLTPFGAHPDRTTRDLFAEAGVTATRDAKVPLGDIDAVYFGNFVGELAEDQGHQGPIVAESLGVQAPATRFESACASSGVAVRHAVRAIDSGRADVVIVGGAERMTHVGTDGATAMLATAADAIHESNAGMTFPGAYAIMTDAYFRRHGGSRRDLAHVAVKNHEHALENEYAQFQSRVTVDEVLEAPTVASPLGLLDACPVTDGASALVLVSEQYAAEHTIDAPVAVTGSGQGTDRAALQDRETPCRTPATERAAVEAYEMAGIAADTVDVVEVHDCFTCAEVFALEGLGLFDPGEAITAAREGATWRDGVLPVNCSGGLKAKGHPVGATGASQIVELTRLLRGDHPNSDYVADALTGVAHSAGGTVASTTVHVLEVVG